MNLVTDITLQDAHFQLTYEAIGLIANKTMQPWNIEVIEHFYRGFLMCKLPGNQDFSLVLINQLVMSLRCIVSRWDICRDKQSCIEQLRQAEYTICNTLLDHDLGWQSHVDAIHVVIDSIVEPKA